MKLKIDRISLLSRPLLIPFVLPFCSGTVLTRLGRRSFATQKMKINFVDDILNYSAARERPPFTLLLDHRA